MKAGQPVRLVVDRHETSGCSEEVVFGIRRYLPAHQQTVVELTPPAAGTYEITGGMGMLRGTLVAESAVVTPLPPKRWPTGRRSGRRSG